MINNILVGLMAVQTVCIGVAVYKIDIAINKMDHATRKIEIAASGIEKSKDTVMKEFKNELQKQIWNVIFLTRK